MSNLNELSICSLNVRGLGDTIKRRETFRWLRNKKYSIYFLQEVHSTSETEKFWTKEWGYTALFSSCFSAKGGVCVLFNNNFTFQILKQYCDPEGRFIIIDIKTEDRTLTLINIYAPNKDDPSFFQKVIDYSLDFACGDIVFGGDFNTVLDVTRDKKKEGIQQHTLSLFRKSIK